MPPRVNSAGQSNQLWVAASRGDIAKVHSLLASGRVLVDRQSLSEGTSPLYVACQNGYVDVVLALLSAGAKVDLESKDGSTPLWVASGQGHTRVVHVLLSVGANVNPENSPPLFAACVDSHVEIVHALISAGAAVNVKLCQGFTPLHVAIGNGHVGLIRALVLAGADVNMQGNDGTSPLYAACRLGREEPVHALLSAGAKVDLLTDFGASPLHAACACEDVDDHVVDALLLAGAKVNLQTDDGTSPLHAACWSGCMVPIYFLLDADSVCPAAEGADANLQDSRGFSPLHVSSQVGHESGVDTLLRYGAKIDLQSKDGASPLYLACERGITHIDVIRLLLESGARADLRAKNGMTPMDVLPCSMRSEMEQVAQQAEEERASVSASRRLGESGAGASTTHGCAAALTPPARCTPASDDGANGSPEVLNGQGAEGGGCSIVAEVVPRAATCAMCGGPPSGEGSKLKACGRCTSVRYCSQECQKKHWQGGGHKEACPQLREEREMRNAARARAGD